MLIRTYGSAVYGVDAQTITIEVNISTGINYFLVGLPDNAIKESQQRMDAALKNNGYKIPGKGITINMAPANIRKEGSSYDLTLADSNATSYQFLPKTWKEDGILENSADRNLDACHR